MLAHRDAAARELDELEGADTHEAELEAERSAGRVRLAAAAAELSRGRQRAAAELARAVEPMLRELAMPGARFEVALPPAPAPEGLPCGAGGAEAPEFLLSANKGERPKPLREVASGGELSRPFLALKQALANRRRAWCSFRQGRRGRWRGAPSASGAGSPARRAHQVPQIAAYAHRHFRVAKHRRSGPAWRSRRSRRQRVPRSRAAMARAAGGARFARELMPRGDAS